MILPGDALLAQMLEKVLQNRQIADLRRSKHRHSNSKDPPKSQNLRLAISRRNLALPIRVRDLFIGPILWTGVLLAEEGSDLLAGDLALFSILPAESPKNDCFLCILAEDTSSFGLSLTSSLLFSSPSLFSAIVAVEMVSLTLQVSENPEISLALMKVGILSSFSPSYLEKDGFVCLSAKEALGVSGIAAVGFRLISGIGFWGIFGIGMALFAAAKAVDLAVVKELLKHSNKESIAKKNQSGFDVLQKWSISINFMVDIDHIAKR